MILKFYVSITLSASPDSRNNLENNAHISKKMDYACLCLVGWFEVVINNGQEKS